MTMKEESSLEVVDGFDDVAIAKFGCDFVDAILVQTRLGFVQKQAAAFVGKFGLLLIQAGQFDKQGVARVGIQVAAQVDRCA